MTLIQFVLNVRSGKYETQISLSAENLIKYKRGEAESGALTDGILNSFIYFSQYPLYVKQTSGITFVILLVFLNIVYTKGKVDFSDFKDVIVFFFN